MARSEQPVWADSTTVLENNDAGVYGRDVALYATKLKVYAARYDHEEEDAGDALGYSGYSNNTDAALSDAS